MEMPTKRFRNSSLDNANIHPRPKRSPKTEMNVAKSTSPFMPSFEYFRSELDEHHDRRERIIKASRDVTANSKKAIFALQRVPFDGLAKPLPDHIAKAVAPYLENADKLLKSVVADLQSIDAWRYYRQISPGIQEFMEAVIFRHYLTTQTLLTYTEAQILVPQGITLTEDDWLLGVMDSIGEIMRFSITGIATSGSIAGQSGEGKEGRHVVNDLRELRVHLDLLNAKGSGLARDLGGKQKVMRACVEKVENAAYGLAVRDNERPVGWVPDERMEELN